MHKRGSRARVTNKVGNPKKEKAKLINKKKRKTLDSSFEAIRVETPTNCESETSWSRSTASDDSIPISTNVGPISGKPLPKVETFEGLNFRERILSPLLVSLPQTSVHCDPSSQFPSFIYYDTISGRQTIIIALELIFQIPFDTTSL
ncbi:hypothetical protein AFLA_005920 [Aspergillus flavus NRRL3357]|nr:hypothetical protein AFLA_005920 [Aspergillus flavus NRRL3357]